MRITKRVLAIETSCDETSAAVLSGSEVLPVIESHIILSQESASRAYGGVVPELVARAHLKTLDSVITRALRASKHSLSEIDLIAATCGPGLLGGLIIGSLMGKTLALARGIPFMAINHLEGHALSPRLSSLTEPRAVTTPTTPQQEFNLDFPYLLLLVSGGHCQLLNIESLGSYRLLGQTRDDSVGECLDKGARLLGLREYNGAAVERAALRGDSSRFARDFTTLPTPMRATSHCDFSFSGLKSALARALHGRDLDEQQRYDGAAALQAAVISSLCDRSARALKLTAAERNAQRKKGQSLPSPSPQHSHSPSPPPSPSPSPQHSPQHSPKPLPLRFAVAGGVSANRQLCSQLESLALREGFSFFSPRQELCTDNAAMIAYAALARTNPRPKLRVATDTLADTLAEDTLPEDTLPEDTAPCLRGDIDFFVRPRWSLDERASERACTRTPA